MKNFLTIRVFSLCILVVFFQSACAHSEIKRKNISSNENISSNIFFFKDGTVEVRDYQGKIIIPIDEDKFFSCSNLDCKGVTIDRILRIRPAVISIDVKGSHYEVRKIGNQIFKIPLPPPHP